jgi:pilus assembly protein CpaF
MSPTQELSLSIRKPDGSAKSYALQQGIYTVGSDEDCSIHLPGSGVSDRHAILTVNPDTFWIEDLDSETGTAVDKKPVQGRKQIQQGNTVSIDAYELRLGPQQAPAEDVPEPPSAQPDPPDVVSAIDAVSTDTDESRAVRRQIHEELVERLDLKRLAASRIDREELRDRAVRTIRTIVDEVIDRLPAGLDPDFLIKQICDEALGLGPLEDFLADPDVTEIMVNGPDQIYYEKAGKLVRSPQTFMDADSVLAIIERIVSPIGRRIDESQPYVDARLPDGSRVNAIIHPLSLVGPCLTIRKFSETPFTAEDLIGFGSMTADFTTFIEAAIRLRKNIIVSGGTGSGKTTLLNVLSDFIPADDRIVTIEDAAELRLKQDHVVRLEARPPNIEGRGAVTIRDLVRNALRMRPDRIVVGECRGGEALDMLQAMNTGHDGSLTTIHANTPRDVIARLDTMVLMSGMDLPIRAIREQIASAVHLIVHISRFSDGTRRVAKVTEIVGLEGSQVTMQDLFEHVQTGIDADGKVLGHFGPTGAVPTFIEEVSARGIALDHAIFNPRNLGDRVNPSMET